MKFSDFKFQLSIQSRRLLADLHTPVSLYLKLRDVYPGSAMLESSDYHASDNSRSYIAVCPMASISVNGGRCEAIFPNGRREAVPADSTVDISEAFESFLSAFDVRGGREKAICGLFGYTAYDIVRYLEDIPVPETHHAENDAPDMMYTLYRFVFVFDHFRNELTIVELIADGESSRIDDMERLIANRNIASYNFRTVGEEQSSMTDEEYMQAVRTGVGHCLRGDVFQIVLSRRFEQAFQGDDFKVYRALRGVNPSPYLFYFDFGGFRIFGSSPETHCRITPEGRISIDPIAGTAVRTGDTAADRNRTEALLADPKENAEHVMLVDLARNDLSRNATDVRVEFFREVQYYSHVIHLTSRVSGQLNDDASPVKAFLDTFPAGTLSGAPKVRAMQLINDIEPHNRGAYGGCIGFIGLDGSLNQAITIRSFVSRGNVLYYQAGAGIVAKSRPEYELREVNGKLAALKQAVINPTPSLP
jgi:anthranilate synthase component 1